jgi:hypothetical protein
LRRSTLPFPRRLVFVLAVACALSSLSAACAVTSRAAIATPTAAPTIAITLVVDGQTRPIATSAATVGDALAEAGITLNPLDEIEPPVDTELFGAASDSEPLVVTVVRVTEALEVVPESIPYARQIVRSAEMSPDDPPRLLQTGKPGLQEITVRIVYRDGLEVERWPTATTVIEPSRDEIVMIGVGSERDAMPISGILAYINDGRAILLEGSTDSPRQLPIEGNLDGRVFQLSPDGRSLLYTVNTAEGPEQGGFRNELWVIPTDGEGEARSLQIGNVLWAGWDPAALETPRIAYTTARSVSLPPGWEANNDLWLLELPRDTSQLQPAPLRLIETYPAALGWWGGNYTWAPGGDRLAYAFADEVGLLQMPDSADSATITAAEPARAVLRSFTEFDTGAEWAWVPALSWSADGRYLAFTEHAGADGSGTRFDLLSVDTSEGDTTILVEGAGMWAVVQWSPVAASETRLAYLRANDPAASEDSVYSLWLANGDGEDAQRVFPPEDESGLFAQTSQSLVWGPDENIVAFIFDDTLHFLDLATGDVALVGDDDTGSSHLTWAPYGAGTLP